MNRFCVLLWTGVLVMGSESNVVAMECPNTAKKLANGMCLPFASNGDVMHHTPSVNDTTAIALWLKAGGRGIDSAWSYDHGGYGHPQRLSGIAIKASGLPRDELFVLSKIPCATSTEEVLNLVRYDLDQFMLSQLDSILIHHPNSPACNSSDQIITTWQGLQMALEQNLTKSIGVSNFGPSDLDSLAKAPTTKVTPLINQIELAIGSVDNATIEYCNQHGITVEAYSPLGHPDRGGKAVYDLPQVLAVAKMHNVTGAQVALKFLIQQGFPFVTASPTLEYDQEDLDLFDWMLTDSDIRLLNSIRL